ncbi:fibroblast growth factor 22 [Carettochelys insculpta]|uniref:fibroblast growth factor 22 n=1 Tax=Carettochelys insculpta TaxID=44489 RepID=UPI003EC0C0EC
MPPSARHRTAPRLRRPRRLPGAVVPSPGAAGLHHPTGSAPPARRCWAVAALETIPPSMQCGGRAPFGSLWRTALGAQGSARDPFPTFCLLHPGILEIRLVRVGSVAIKSAHTGFYLATNKKGKVYGSVGSQGVSSSSWALPVQCPGRSGHILLAVAALLISRGGCPSAHLPGNAGYNPRLFALLAPLPECTKLPVLVPFSLPRGSTTISLPIRQYNPSCEFRERTEENGYNTHAALCGRPAGCLMFLAGKGKGKPRQWGRTRCQDLSAHFLPVFIS